MKITKNNFNEKMDLIAKALVKSEYDRECFSKSDIELNNIVWREFEEVSTELTKAKLMLPMSKARGFCKAIIEAPFLNY